MGRCGPILRPSGLPLAAGGAATATQLRGTDYATATRRGAGHAQARHAARFSGGARVMSLASLRRFCAMAARVNSNWAPLSATESLFAGKLKRLLQQNRP